MRNDIDPPDQFYNGPVKELDIGDLASYDHSDISKSNGTMWMICGKYKVIPMTESVYVECRSSV